MNKLLAIMAITMASLLSACGDAELLSAREFEGVEGVYYDPLCPQLGEDTCSFKQVAIGLCQIEGEKYRSDFKKRRVSYDEKNGRALMQDKNTDVWCSIGESITLVFGNGNKHASYIVAVSNNKDELHSIGNERFRKLSASVE